MSKLPTHDAIRKVLEPIRDELARRYEHGVDPDAYVPLTIDGLNAIIETLDEGIYLYTTIGGDDS